MKRVCCFFILPMFFMVICGTIHAQNRDAVTLGGWIDAQYRYMNDNGGESSVMQIRRARMDMKGKLADRLDFRLQADFAASPKLIDAFAKIKFADAAQLQVGQFKIPFSLENKLSPLDLELTDNALAVKYLSGYSDVTGIGSYANGRDIGVLLAGELFKYEDSHGTMPLVRYGVGLFGGNGINVKTDDMWKDLSARIELCPFVRDVVISGSAYIGKYEMLAAGQPTGTGGDRRRWAVGAQYDNRHLTLRSECLWGVTDFAVYDAIHDSYTSEGMYSRAWYVTGGYWITTGSNVRMRPVARYDHFEKDAAKNTYTDCYSAGMEWWAWGCLRLQLAYTLTDKKGNNALGHSVTTMATVKF